ncbi:MAG: replication initiation factor domain-containing protein, partial [Cyanobacteria bacterium J06648_11]
NPGEYGRDPDGRFLINISGDALARIGLSKAKEVIQWVIDRGGHFTRLDVAVDFHNHTQASLADKMQESYAKGEVCRFRGMQRIVKLRKGVIAGDTLYFGTRGKNGSGRFIRVYDKGLKEGTDPIGSWVRFEAEFSSDVAQQVAHAVLEADPYQLQLIAFDCIEFREVTGDAHRSRRPMCEWWSKVRGAGDLSGFTRRRTASTVSTFCRWVETSIAPSFFKLKDMTGLEVEELLVVLTGEHVPDDAKARKPRPLLKMLVSLMQEEMARGSTLGKRMSGRGVLDAVAA